MLAACATPAERVASRAAELGFDEIRLQGEGFRHLAYTASVPSSIRTLHVYIEHDGTPWADRLHVSADPTPRNPVALELMARDAGPRLWLGRPCYSGLAAEPGCDPLVWTHRRYSPEVVHSMVAALRGFLATYNFGHVVLIGHSGGGTLAWLMAAQMSEVSGVVTLAANLDIDRWARLHGYSTLVGSQNPAASPPLPPTVVQRHFGGANDVNVPPSILESFALRHPEARVTIFAGYDHECCWVARWPQLLDEATGGSTNAATPAN